MPFKKNNPGCNCCEVEPEFCSLCCTAEYTQYMVTIPPTFSANYRCSDAACGTVGGQTYLLNKIGTCVWRFNGGNVSGDACATYTVQLSITKVGADCILNVTVQFDWAGNMFNPAARNAAVWSMALTPGDCCGPFDVPFSQELILINQKICFPDSFDDVTVECVA